MSTSIMDLVRPDLRSFAGYSSARRAGLSGSVWLNANESPWASLADVDAQCQRYPSPQPEPLRQALAALYEVEPQQVLIGRGSDEAIDLLVRGLCRPEQDAVLISSPVFGMYAVSARLQGARLIDVPLVDGPRGFSIDLSVLSATAEREGARVIFLCSPGNPTGHSLSLQTIARLAERLAGQAMVVVDEAYIEYSDVPSATALLPSYPNLAVLRTLSKAHALPGARIGCLIATPELIDVLRNCQAPYPLPTPCAELALAALQPDALARTRAHIEEVCAERERLTDTFSCLPGIRRVYPSQGNFLLLRFDDAETAFNRLLEAGVVVRDQRFAPQLHDALRISIGTPAENAIVIHALQDLETAA